MRRRGDRGVPGRGVRLRRGPGPRRAVSSDRAPGSPTSGA
jgi:hypothetical protein